MIEIFMPQLGESVTEGTIAGWLKQPGDPVAVDEPVCEVSTDKVTFEVPATTAGRLAEILAPEGAVVAVGTPIARLETGEQAGTPVRPSGGSAAGPDPAGEPPPDPVAIGDAAPADRAARRGAGRLSPLVRRLASQTGIDPASVRGTGLGGRVTRDDMLRAAADRPETASQPGVRAPAPSVAPDPSYPVQPMPGDEVVPFSAVRRSTARHMVHSVRTAPHGFISFEVDYGSVEAVRRERREAFRAAHGASLTTLPFVVRAVALALRRFPLVNAAVDGDSLVVRRPVNIGIAVDLAHRGLVVPVLRDADTLNVAGIARAISGLADRARAGGLGPDDLSGGTFTITNPGAAGTHVSVPIINQPQVAILVTDGIHRRPAVAILPDGSEAIVVRPLGHVGLSMDHRAFDGAYAAAFLAAVKSLIEERDWRNDL